MTETQRTTPDPDVATIRECLSGNPTAFAALVERHQAPLRRVVLGIVADPHLAEDVLQDAFLIAYRNLHTFRGESRFGTWLYRVTVREALRMQKRWAQVCRRFFPLKDPEAAPLCRQDGTVHREELNDVLAVLNQLPARQRAAFVLHVVDGKTHQEVADLLDCRPGTVGSWIHRARARLSRALEEGTATAGLELAALRGEP